jgi:hypothetical protein
MHYLIGCNNGTLAVYTVTMPARRGLHVQHYELANIVAGMRFPDDIRRLERGFHGVLDATRSAGCLPAGSKSVVIVWVPGIDHRDIQRTRKPGRPSKSTYSLARIRYIGYGNSDPKKVLLHGAGEFLVMAADYDIPPKFISLVIPRELRSAWLLPGAKECRLGILDPSFGFTLPDKWVSLSEPTR